MAHYFRIDHQLKLLAVFSPKCASNSIHRWMDGLAQASGQGADFKRQDATKISAHQLGDYPDYLSVLFLRDPLRRLVSFYTLWIVGNPGIWGFADDDRRFPLAGRSFRAFLFVLDHLFRNDFRFQHHLEMQTGNLSGFKFRHVVLIEKLDEGLRRLNVELGLDILPSKQNPTVRNDQLEEFVGDRPPRWFRENGLPQDEWFYDQEMVEMAQRIYAADKTVYQSHGGQLLDATHRL